MVLVNPTVSTPRQFDSVLEKDREARIAERVAALEKRLAVDGHTHAAMEAEATEQRRKLLDRLLRQAALLRDMLAASGMAEVGGEAVAGPEEEECWEKTDAEMEAEGGGGEGGGEREGKEAERDEAGVMADSRRTSPGKSVGENDLIGRAHARYWRRFWRRTFPTFVRRLAQAMLSCSHPNPSPSLPFVRACRMCVHCVCRLVSVLTWNDPGGRSGCRAL